MSYLQALKKATKTKEVPYQKQQPSEFIETSIATPDTTGALRKSLGVKKGKTIPAGKLRAAAKKSGKLGQRARLAITLKKLRKK